MIQLSEEDGKTLGTVFLLVVVKLYGTYRMSIWVLTLINMQGFLLHLSTRVESILIILVHLLGLDRNDSLAPLFTLVAAKNWASTALF